MVTIQSMLIGRPQMHRDARGEWQSSIYRTPVAGPVELGPRGLAGDEVTDTVNHGKPDQAVCCHPLDHYLHWNAVYGLTGDAALGPGSLGENWTLTGADEREMCAGDVYRVGTARIVVTGPRYPCPKQNRKLGIPGFAERSGDELRTGFYLGVVEPGVVNVGDAWTLEAQPNPGLSIYAINRAWFHETDENAAADAARAIASPDVPPWWREQFRARGEK